jgi:hypothetical protein
MAIYISIGHNCLPKYQINKYIGDAETLFFDWIETDMSSVISIMNSENLDNILKPENIVLDLKFPTHNKNSRINILPLSKCVSIHDLVLDYTEQDIIDFISKYKRRFERIREHIKTENRIFFLRWGPITPDELRMFNTAILNINTKCTFYVVSITESDEDACTITNNYVEIRSSTFFSERRAGDWTRSHLNWTKIFHILKELDKTDSYDLNK